jgi:uncharacterized protein
VVDFVSQYLRVQPGEYVVELLPEGAVLPSGADWLALTRAPEGLTVVRPVRPDDPADRCWIAFYSGQAAHDLDVTGMLAALLNPLAEAAVPVFVTSTYHADLVFVQAWRRDEAAGTLRRAGHVIQDAADAPA